MIRLSRGRDRAGPVVGLWDLHQKTEAEWRRILAARPDEAVAWIALAAANGFKAAQLVFGQMHLDGTLVVRDPAAAHAWFVKAAAIGSVEARNMVGRCHELGWGVPVDQAIALLHYRKAAAAGLDWAHYNVGCLLLYGTGVGRNHGEAVASFTAAADLGHAKAMGMLGRCHEEGWGTDRDRMAARALYRRAAEGGDGWGALNLGLMLVEDGARAEAIPHLAQAVATATPGGLSAIVDLFERRPEPDLAAIAAAARARLGEVRARPAASEGGRGSRRIPRRVQGLILAALLALAVRRIPRSA
ncbi:tetratricopeptide repeat protein [Methylobacterium sp. Leaf399]|uniref:tetratricopeptide repeat protein n=1 Tax=Methylobacterium sp. Leaf399 TaxID=1736364 RepID=UPI0009EAD838|nr:tetratricopeptide repeat protein [Methylobacterium sp. Leaf399]